MAENDTLLAYLVPAINPQVEPAATRALAYILDKSDTAMEAFNALVRDTTDQTLAPVRRVYAEAGYTTEDGSGGRLDLAGYDLDGEQRVIVEAKLGANLLRGQGSDYLKRLSQNGKSVLMFLVPEYRINYLWDEVKRDISRGTGEIYFPDEKTLGKTRVTEISSSESYLMMVSWRDLLERMEQNTKDETVNEDIHQLQGLAESQDARAFLPIAESELESGFARRMVGYALLIDDVVDNEGVKDNWMDVQGLRATPQRHGYGRYFRFPGMRGDIWFGINCSQWSQNGESPLWLHISGNVSVNMDQIERTLNRQIYGRWIPIALTTKVDRRVVLDNVICQLKEIGRALGAHIS